MVLGRLNIADYQHLKYYLLDSHCIQIFLYFLLFYWFRFVKIIVLKVLKSHLDVSEFVSVLSFVVHFCNENRSITSGSFYYSIVILLNLLVGFPRENQCEGCIWKCCTWRYWRSYTTTGLWMASYTLMGLLQNVFLTSFACGRVLNVYKII